MRMCKRPVPMTASALWTAASPGAIFGSAFSGPPFSAAPGQSLCPHLDQRGGITRHPVHSPSMQSLLMYQNSDSLNYIVNAVFAYASEF